MTTSRRSRQETSLRLNFGPEDGPARTSATGTPNAKASTEPEAGYSSPLRSLLEKFDQDGLSWRMSRGSSARTTAPRLSQLSSNSKRSGIWGYGLRVTLSARAFPTTEREYSLSDLIDRR